MKNNICYLCNKKLNGKVSRDHVIPDELFNKDDTYRPKLTVHYNCNNPKSKEDEWFVKQLQLRSSFNIDAFNKFSIMMDKAIDEKKDAYLIGKNLHNYKLARGMFNEVAWGLEFNHLGQDFQQMRFSIKAHDRFYNYFENLCRGLFIYNIPNSYPNMPKLIVKQYRDLNLKNKYRGFMEIVNNLFRLSGSNLFGQRWGDRIIYFGSRVIENPSKGFICVEFYKEVVALAYFK